MKKKSEKCYCNQDNQGIRDVSPPNQEDPSTSKDIYGHPDVSQKGRRGKVRSQEEYIDPSHKSINSEIIKVTSSVSQDKSDFKPQKTDNEAKPNRGEIIKVTSLVSQDKSDFKPQKTDNEDKPNRGVCTCGRILALDYKPSYNVQYKNNFFFIEIDVNEFTPVGLRVSMTDDTIKVEGVVLQRHDIVDQVCAEFTKTYTVPEEMDLSSTSAELYSNGILVIKAEKKKNSSFSSDKAIVSTSLPLEKKSSSHVKVEIGRDVNCGHCNELRKAPPDSQIVPITEIKENYKGMGNKPKGNCKCSHINDCIKFV